MPQVAVSDKIADLASRFSGQLLQPFDAGYDDARRVHNGLVDKRPFLIARCRNTADVADAVNFAREHSLEVAVRGGGHNVAGRATVDGGLMIDLSLMKGIHVDAKARTARAQGGVLWKEFNRETQIHGLATTGGVISTTGIAGLTLGGGIGWLMPKYGLALDNLRSADWLWLTAVCFERARMRISTSSGPFAVAAATSASRHPSSTSCTRWGRRSSGVSWRIRLKRLKTF